METHKVATLSFWDTFLLIFLQSLKPWVNVPSLFISFNTFFFTDISLSSVCSWSVCLLTSEYDFPTVLKTLSKCLLCMALLREKCPNSEFFLVWMSTFNQNTRKYRFEKSPNSDTFAQFFACKYFRKWWLFNSSFNTQACNNTFQISDILIYERENGKYWKRFSKQLWKQWNKHLSNTEEEGFFAITINMYH